jgi:hypothetical protein
VLIEGTGNLGYLNVPQPEFGELVVTEREETTRSQAVGKGYEGTRRFDFHFLSEAAGEYSISVPDFVFFDPDLGISRTARGVTYRVLFESESAGSVDIAEEFPFSLPSIDALNAKAKWGAYKDPLNYLWLLPAPLAFFILLILKKAKIVFVSAVFILTAAGDVTEAGCPDLISVIEAYDNGDFESARLGLLACFDKQPANPDLAFALALTEYRLSEFDDSMHYVRTAVRLDPMATRYRDFLLWLNDALELEKPVSPAVTIHPDIFFFGMVGLFSLGFISLSIYLVRRKGLYVILFLLCLLISVGCCACLVQTALKNRRATAIAYGEPASLRKIPSATAQSWLELPPGYSVRILDASGGFYLIETAYGLTGWVAIADLLEDPK